MVSRRSVLGVLAGTVTGFAAGVFAAPQDLKPKTKLGLVTYCCGIRRKYQQEQSPGFDLFEARNFLNHCREVGAGGMQLSLGNLSEAEATALRHEAEKSGQFIEANLTVPQSEADLDRFRREVQIAAWAGAKAIRTVVMPGRRYERFTSLQEFDEFTARALRSLKLAAPIVEKFRVPLAVENHKDHRTDQRVEMLGEISSEYVGACVDTGNSLALLEDPLETVRGLAPWVRSVHLKDQALAPASEGFLLADIPLGQGCLPLQEIVNILKLANPEMEFCLELITRDPLLVPVWEDKYWVTMPTLPARDLARTMTLVRHHTAENLQRLTGLPLQEQVALEDRNVAQSLEFAATQLGFNAR